MSIAIRFPVSNGTAPAQRLRALAAPLVLLLTAACGQIGGGSTAAAKVKDVAEPVALTALAANPVVVELYQSQGCSSCPPANANLNAISDRPDVLALSFAVTYWDRLGWKDSFARQQFTDRQWEYARAGGRGNVSTPQVVINGGRTPIIGHDRKELDAAIAAAGMPKGGPAISPDGNGIALAGGAGERATVWLVRYDPQSREVAIRAGENGGRTLPHRGIVRELVRLGAWTGEPIRFDLPPAQQPGLNGAVLVQQGEGGPITAARRV